MKVVSVAAVALIVGLMALTAAAGSVGKDERVQLIPRTGVNLVKCETKTKRIGCNECEYSKCTAGRKVWADSIMRCTDRDCSKRRFEDLELEEEEVHADFDFE